jgi:hypothetical protein
MEEESQSRTSHGAATCDVPGRPDGRSSAGSASRAETGRHRVVGCTLRFSLGTILPKPTPSASSIFGPEPFVDNGRVVKKNRLTARALAMSGKANAERGEGVRGGAQGGEVCGGGTSNAEDGKAAAGETAPSAPPGLAKAKTNGGEERAQDWVGAKYSRHTLLELAKSAAALRRPPDIPLQFCRDEPGNLAERAKNERAARRKDERDKEKERKDKGVKGGREMRGEGDVGFARGAERGQGAGPGAAGGGRGEAVTTGDRHRLMMEEVERERAAFAAVRNQQKADDMARKAVGGAPASLDVNRSVFEDSIGGLGSAAEGSGQGILDMLFVGGRGVGGEDDVTAGMGDLSVQIPLPAVVPPEASPSKFATSRAGRWFSPAAAHSEGTGDLAFGESGGAELPAAVANLWGSPAPAARPAEQPTGQMPPGASLVFPVHHGQQGPMGGVGGMMGHGIMMQRPSGQGGGGQAAPSPESTLSQLLNINASLNNNTSSAPPPSNPTAAQGSSAQTKMNNLPPPVAPLARPGNRCVRVEEERQRGGGNRHRARAMERDRGVGAPLSQMSEWIQ